MYQKPFKQYNVHEYCAYNKKHVSPHIYNNNIAERIYQRIGIHLQKRKIVTQKKSVNF